MTERATTRLTGKVALVTGAARGMGAAEAQLLVERGARVLLGDVLREEGRALADSLGDQADFVTLDVRSEEDWAGAIARAKDRFGHVNVLVNNAGIGRMAPIADMSLADYMDVVEINQVGVFLGIRAVVPAMIEAGGGSIINISSVEGLVGMAGGAAYCASKHAVVGMTKAAALELASVGIRVNSLNPGIVDTPLVRAIAEAHGEDVVRSFTARIPLQRLGAPEEIARFVCFLASDASAYCNGAAYVIDGGVLAG